MEIKKIALVGSTGYIGQEIINTFNDPAYSILQIDKQSIDEIEFLDLKHPESFNYEVLRECQFVIFTAAISGPDYCANSYEDSYSINVTGTEYFISKAIEQNCKVLFFSSDAVFGVDDKIFNENSETKAHTAYGKMKKRVEDSFKGNSLFKAIRLSYVFSQKDKFTQYLYSCLNNNQEAEVFHPFYRNVVMLNEVLFTVKWLINNWESHPHSFLNICGNDLISRVQIVDEINRISPTNIKYKIKFPEKEFFLNRPEVTEMQSVYLRNILSETSEPFSARLSKQILINK